jgi:hypothetical protein
MAEIEEKKIQQIQRKKGAGNTKQDAPALYWCFTLNNYTELNIQQILNSKIYDQLCMQEEKGENGTPHIQGWLKGNKKLRFSCLKKINDRMHLEKCIDRIKGRDYCRKDDTRNGRRWEINIPKLPRPLFLIDEEKMEEWQTNIKNIINNYADHRTIWWYWDEKGNTGKTSMARWLVSKKYAIYLDGGKGNDIKHLTATALQANPDSDIVIFDFPRTLEGKVSYSAIECIKNGIFSSGKYEGANININPPHVIIFANWKPDTKQLSKDRWNIVCLDKED